MCRMIEPSSCRPIFRRTESFTQRGNVGIEVFDKHTRPLPTIQAPGIYRLSVSPNRRWLRDNQLERPIC
jgi:hypothetical protein